MRQAAHQCRDLDLAYLYQKAGGMGVEHLTHAIGSDLDAQAIHHERLRTLRRKRAGLNLLSATLMALATGPGTRSMSEEPPMPPESSLSQPAVEKESEAEESEAVPSIAAAEEDSVVTLPDLEQYVAEHGATKARLDVKFNPDAPRFTFQRLEDETATTLMDWYSEAGFLESLQMRPQNIIRERAIFDLDGTQVPAIFYLRSEDGRFVGMKLDGGITLGETNYDEVYYDAGQTLAFAKRVDRTADDGTPDEVTVTRYLPHEDWSYYLQVTMSPNAMEGASEFSAPSVLNLAERRQRSAV